MTKQGVLRSDRAMQQVTALIAVFALCLRLAWPAAPVLTATIDPADFGEHALCLAGGADVPSPAKDAPSAPSNHHGLVCCPFHAAFGTAPAPPVAAGRIAYAEIVLRSPPNQPYLAPVYPPGTSPARAPPTVI